MSAAADNQTPDKTQGPQQVNSLDTCDWSMARVAQLRKLAAWLEEQPGTMAAWNSMEVADYGPAGFGFRAVGDIKKGDLLCMIPCEHVRKCNKL